MRETRSRSSLVLLPALGLLISCGKGSPAESPSASRGESYDQPEARASDETPTSAPAAPEGKSAPNLDGAGASRGTSAAPPPAFEGPPQSHDLTYHVSPDGIWVEILKARFRPTAKTIKVPGGKIVELEVEVESEEAYSLLSGDSGPLAVAGRVRRPAEELRVDERGESKSVKITPAKTEVFKRRFPTGSVKPIKPGEQLEIRVGLWGFGEEDATLPVKRLFVVKMAPDKDSDHLEVLLPEGVAE